MIMMMIIIVVQWCWYYLYGHSNFCVVCISLGSTGKRLWLSREFCYLLMMEKLLGLCGLVSLSLSLFYLGCSLHQTNYESLSFSVCKVQSNPARNVEGMKIGVL